MATNFLFDQFENAQEQQLLHDLVEEAHQIMGEDVVYITRTMQAEDDLWTEDAQSLYSDSYDIEMYIQSVSGFDGRKDFLNAFGANIQDEVTWSCAIRAWEKHVQPGSGFKRPREGDLIFFPKNRKVFKITFVESRDMFYQLGDLYTWSIRTELFKHSGERFDTGIDEVDRINAVSVNVVDWALMTEDDELLTDESGHIIVWDGPQGYDLKRIAPNSQNDFFQSQFDAFVDWTEADPFTGGAL